MQITGGHVAGVVVRFACKSPELLAVIPLDINSYRKDAFLPLCGENARRLQVYALSFVKELVDN